MASALAHLSRPELYALTQTARDLPALGGNANGVFDEARAPTFGKVPLLLDVESRFRVGLSADDEIKFLTQVYANKRAAWGDAPITTLPAGALANPAAFELRKVLELAKYDRRPEEVTEAFVKATGTVDGQAIAPREVFTQRYAPRAGVAPTGKVIVISPGFQETGRNFLEQLDALTRAGHTVVTLDHQWAGHTKGAEAGTLDRLYGAARDVAAVAAAAQASLATDPRLAKVPASAREVVVLGNSMGGAAALAAAVLVDHGRLELGGGLVAPKGLRLALQSPFLEPAKNLSTMTATALAKLPLVNKVELRGVNVPPLAFDADTQAKTAQEALLERIVARPEAMVRANDDLADLRASIAAGARPLGQVVVAHGVHDRLAAFAGTTWLAAELGLGADAVVALDTKNHVLEQSRAEHGAIVGLLEAMFASPRAAS